MRRIATIADKNIQREMELWVKSLRMQGWDDTIYIFSPAGDEPDLPDGCEGVVPVDPWWTNPGSRIANVYNKAACIKPDIFLHFDLEDSVLYLDSGDLLVFCSPDEIFDQLKGASLASAYFKNRPLQKFFPLQMTHECGLNLSLVNRTKELNSGVIVAQITPRIQAAMRLWKRMLLYLRDCGPLSLEGKRLGDQVLYNYIFRELEKQDLTTFLPDTYNFRGHHEVAKLRVVDGKVVRRSGAEVKVPHASGIKGMPRKIKALVDESYLLITNNAVNRTPVDIGSVKTSVIMPAYKSDWCIGRALDSIAGQSILPTEVLVGIDACGDTRDAIMDAVPDAIADRTQVFYFPEHVGCYVIRNTLADKATGDVLSFFDSDDQMLPYYNVAGLSKLRKNTIVSPASCWMQGGEVIREKHTPHGAFFIHRDEFLRLNGFEPWVCSADSEFQERAKRDGITRIKPDIVTFIRHKHDNNLTVCSETNARSKIRKDYHRIIKQRKRMDYVKTTFETCECEGVL